MYDSNTVDIPNTSDILMDYSGNGCNRIFTDDIFLAFPRHDNLNV